MIRKHNKLKTNRYKAQTSHKAQAPHKVLDTHIKPNTNNGNPLTRLYEQHFKRARFWGVWILAIIATMLLLYTDADHGLYTALFLTTLFTGSIALAYSHFLRKAMLDYVDLREYAIIAKGHPTAAGLVVLAVAILMVGLLNLLGGLMHDFSNANNLMPMAGALHD
ncbi:hypothetical protein [Hydromonas duriensis]|uniref:Uncharacterized protein n=1 Tax=Hydromonas duriensis TaxID=1527608 RepID=A0A4R6Y5D1_9BURK|nr:hypothetical protein [Hydromonas duriensis]TDR30358.1 hypothetical protein DFR44_12227 [Hydromonas duriensis]